MPSSLKIFSILIIFFAWQFGEIINGVMQLIRYRTIAATEWVRSTNLCQETELREWVVMPNKTYA